MSQNTIKGSARKAHTTRSGVYLERGYVYLTPEAWEALYALSSSQSLSASEYIASIITPTTADGTTIKDSNDITSSAN